MIDHNTLRENVALMDAMCAASEFLDKKHGCLCNIQETGIILTI